MMCLKPVRFSLSGGLSPCGQCINCKVNKKRVWIARALLECTQHDAAYFLTLTLDVPKDQVVGVYETWVDKHYLKMFFRRLSKEFHGSTFKHFAIGEYGTIRGRAHYHVLLWSSVIGISRDIFTRLWRHGSVDVGDIQPSSIDYVMGYLIESKLPKSNIFSSESGRIAHPCFRSISKRIGKHAVSQLAVQGTLNRDFRVLGKTYPIGRYLRLSFLQETSLAKYWENHAREPPIQKSPEILVEQALCKQLRSVSPDSSAYQKIRNELIQFRESQNELAIKRRQIAHYRQINNPYRSRKNETF